MTSYGSATSQNMTHAAAGHIHAGHEFRDVSAPWTIFSAAVVAGIVVGCCIASRFVFACLLEPADSRGNTSATGEGLVLPPAPRLEGIDMMITAQHADVAQLSVLQTERRRLQTYAWVDQRQRTVRIPIERAMETVIKQGLSAISTSLATPKPAATNSTRPPNGNLEGPNLNRPLRANDENR